MSAARVLVVDDSLTIRRALELILKPVGYELDFAADGAQALERATSFAPDLILLDYVLPDMRAPDVCAALAAGGPTALTPIILVSAKGASIRQAYQDAQNVVSYITKPFKPQVVASVVENALARARSKPATGAAHRAPSAPAYTAAATDADERRTLATEHAAAAPASVEQAFAALLAQLEGAMCEEPAGRPGHPRPAGAIPGVSPRLRHAAERLSDVAQHLSGDLVVPYRLRADGSFANVASTLLEAHRSLCEAAILLAATGAPAAALPRSPDVLVVCAAEHPLAAPIADVVRARGLVPLVVGDEVEQLPHLVRLLDPRLVVVVFHAPPGAERALRRSLDAVAGGPPFVAVVPPEVDPGEIDPRVASRVEGLDGLGAVLASLDRRADAPAEQAPDIDLEVIAI